MGARAPVNGTEVEWVTGGQRQIDCTTGNSGSDRQLVPLAEGQYRYSCLGLSSRSVVSDVAIWQVDAGSGVLLQFRQGNHSRVEPYNLGSKV